MRATSSAIPGGSPMGLLGALLLGALAGCFGDDGDPGPPGPPGGSGGSGTDDTLDAGEHPPGVRVAILALSGASAADGSFQVGDLVSVTYTLTKDDGSPWSLPEMDLGRAHFAGPTFNYQRVLGEVGDLAARSVPGADGSYTYTFLQPIPAAYLAPYNDSPDIDAGHGDLGGQPLLGGTYTLGLSFGWRYTVEGVPYLDLGEASRDVRLGGAGELTPRRVTSQELCDRCHVHLLAHDGQRHELVQCLMCHTSGAEDRNDPALGAGTPGVSVDSRVLFHKLHDAAHLPSVLGIGLAPNGGPDYDVEPRPLVYASAAGELVDFSFVGYPAWPSRTIPREKNQGWSGLTEEQRAREDGMRTGVIACFTCHGDPDGDGPLQAPEDGDLIYVQPSRRTCGACHDDVDFTRTYTNNEQFMPPQEDDADCIFCHDSGFSSIGIRGAHRHPLEQPHIDPGLRVGQLRVLEGGAHDGNGSIDVGEGIRLRFTLTDEAGADVDPTGLEEVRVVVAGPSENLQLLLDGSLPPAALVGPQPFEIEVPQDLELEFVGDSTAALDVFVTARRPHLDLPGARTTVHLRVAEGAATGLTSAVPAGTNRLEVADGTGFARGDVVVIADGLAGGEEYARVELAEPTRLWLSPPAVATGHGPGTEVRVVSLRALVEGLDYDLDPASGRVIERQELGATRAVLVSYTAPFRVPPVYPAPAHDSADLDETTGEWRAKSLVGGTYSVALWAATTATTTTFGETNVYPVASRAVREEFAVEGAPVARPWAGIDLPAACDACHQDLRFHGGAYRGFEGCLVCHGSAGSEDLPPYLAAAAPPTPAVEVNFRQLLHRVHRGMNLDDPQGYQVVGAGDDPYPDNFQVNRYDTIRFPALPGATRRCVRCHGAGNQAWREPVYRDHPTEQDRPVRSWRAACTSCHDAPAAVAHVDSHTAPNGVESCPVCHGIGERWNVEEMHRVR